MEATSGIDGRGLRSVAMPTRHRSNNDAGALRLPLAQRTVLGLVAEGPTHGFALARLVDARGTIGEVFYIPRPIVYRALDSLLAAGLVAVEGVQASHQGPQRTRYRITGTGRRAVGEWLNSPVDHVRDMRTEFLVKMILLERAGSDIDTLVRAQRDAIAPIVAALGEQVRAAGSERVVSAWRYATAQAALRFLDDLAR